MRGFPKLFVLHQETQIPAPIPANEQEWPERWKLVEFKEYPRMPRVPLPKPEPLPMTLLDAMARRRSRRSFNPDGTLTPGQLSSLLFWSAGLNAHPHPTDAQTFFRFYPSGGARYPLEVYFYFRGNTEVPTGIYHYNVRHHRLERLPIPEPERWVKSLPTYPWVYDAPMVIFITGVFERTMRKYRARGYRFAIIEAGAMLQNFSLVAEALGLACCGIGSPFDADVEAALEVRGVDESAIVAVAVGPLPG